jgi:hypothetical protein
VRSDLANNPACASVVTPRNAELKSASTEGGDSVEGRGESYFPWEGRQP